MNLSLSFVSFVPPLFGLATHESAILAIDGPKMTNSTTLGLVTSLKMMMMVVGVLNFAAPQSSPTSENLTIVRIFGLQDPVCCVEESLISMEYSKGLLVLKYIGDSQDIWLLLCIQGACTVVLLVCVSPGFAGGSCCCIVLSANEMQNGRCQSAR